MCLVLVLVGISSPQVASAATRVLPWGPPTPLVRGTSSLPLEFGDWLHRGADRSMLVSREGPDLAFARLDAAARPVAVKDAEYVASGWDGKAAIVIAQVRCGGRTRRTDAWVLTGSRTLRASVWPCQRGQPPMELDGAGRLVLVGHLRKNLFVARASCRLTAWVARPSRACRAPRA